MAAEEADEPGRADLLPLRQAFRCALEEDDLLGPAGPYRLHQASALAKLSDQRTRHLGKCG